MEVILNRKTNKNIIALGLATYLILTTSHLKSLNNNYLSPEIIEQQLPLT
jgi:hypothetical protein